MEMTRPTDTHEGSWTSPDDGSDPAGCGRLLAGRTMRDRISSNNILSEEHEKSGIHLHLQEIVPARHASYSSGDIFLFRLPLFFKFFSYRLRHLTVGGEFHGKLGLALGQRAQHGRISKHLR